MLATLSPTIVEGPEWVFEEKYDGIRAVAGRERGRVTRSQTPPLGGYHREGRAVDRPARRAFAVLAQSQGAQRIRIRHRRLHAAEGRPPAPRCPPRRPLRRTEASLRRQGGHRLHA